MTNQTQTLTEIRERATQDGWCRREDCQYVNWRSGTVPTHRRGDGCPEGPHHPAMLEEWLSILAALDAVLAKCEELRFKGKGQPDDMPDEGTEIEDATARRIRQAVHTALDGGGE